jgi:hypothetical protein
MTRAEPLHANAQVSEKKSVFELSARGAGRREEEEEEEEEARVDQGGGGR